jgi:hypothetical protein
MGSIWEGLKRGAKALVHPGPGKYIAAGLPVRCPHCEGISFIEGSALLSTVGLRFLNLDAGWADNATTLMCDQCGLIQWFGMPPQRQ